MNRYTGPARPRRRTASGLPVEGAVPPRGPRVIKRRHTRAWFLLTLLLLTVVGGTVFWRLQKSEYFTVRHVRVSGATHLDNALVADAAGVVGKEIYRVDSAAAAAAVQKIPMVQAARVRRTWPNTIDVEVSERTPWGTWQIGGVNYLIDRTGAIIDIVDAPWPKSIYELDAAPGLQPGDHVDADAIKLAEILIPSLPRTLAQQVTKLEYSPDTGVELITDQGVRVRLGDSQGLDYKLAVWQALNAKLGSGQVRLIDLRSSERPFYR